MKYLKKTNKKYSDKGLTHQTQSFFSLKTLNKILLLC